MPGTVDRPTSRARRHPGYPSTARCRRSWSHPAGDTPRCRPEHPQCGPGHPQCHPERSRRVWGGWRPDLDAWRTLYSSASLRMTMALRRPHEVMKVGCRIAAAGIGDEGGFVEHVSEVLGVVSCGPPCDEIPVFTGMTKLEYGTVPHNSGENRNPMDRDSGGLNITKQALETRHYNTTRRQSLFSYQ